ncbi:hypothetical protein SAMN05216319_3480 [Duganella sp. CF402]|uniref:DUF4810 domain-containing protein n=1 Tax=unclassified Duganella TaxID=2636909 RepID=UPI0008CE9224|nr:MULTISPECIES: DUF4810 domain-containing protein [unclassified Duganella]RZT08112.1 hypothetical protein EV582_0137 [Duganella sp. BK701]SEM05198.1 hypothetical protein SAMN05216319_3480 [Duganella sp. CF402]
MNNAMIKRAALALALAGAALLTGCASGPKTLYGWDGYQPQVYQHFKGESPDQQIAEMEKSLQAISAKGASVPPGFHAHLGMLYSMTGKLDQMVAQFEDEKKLFPESAAYMDFLLAKVNKGEKL